MTLRTSILAFAATVALGTSALAHSKSETTVPADGTAVKAVEAISMRFDKPMRVTVVKLLRGADEHAIERKTGMEAVMEFRALPASTLEPGAYRVEWRGLSVDGHPMQGSFGFSIDPATGE